jgi:hypothetical protein
MRSSNQVPIMTNSESVLQFGNNAYGKPATALNILRETILGRELFDFSFKEYARRWKFKRPMPADFFRTMEDASGIDLDWFWQGWFYTTDHCDISIDKVAWHTATDGDPDEEAQRRKALKDAQLPTLSETRNKELPKRIDEYPELKDFYNTYDPNAVTPEAREEFRKALEKLAPEEKQMIEQSMHYYQISLKNLGGLVMPIILKTTYEDGTSKVVRLPVDIWAKDNKDASTTIITTQPITSIELDPHRETADTNRDNNYFPARFEPTRFQIYKQQEGEGRRGADVRGGPGRGPGRDPRAAQQPPSGDAEPGEGADNPMRAARRREDAERAKREAADKKQAQEAAKQEDEKSTTDQPVEKSDDKPTDKAADKAADKPAAVETEEPKK